MARKTYVLITWLLVTLLCKKAKFLILVTYKWWNSTKLDSIIEQPLEELSRLKPFNNVPILHLLLTKCIVTEMVLKECLMERFVCEKNLILIKIWRLNNTYCRLIYINLLSEYLYISFNHIITSRPFLKTAGGIVLGSVAVSAVSAVSADVLPYISVAIKASFLKLGMCNICKNNIAKMFLDFWKI